MSLPEELREYVEKYKSLLRHVERKEVENLAKYYVQFEKAAKRLGLHLH